MRPFFIIALAIAVFGMSACGKRPALLETPTNRPLVSNGYPAVEPIPDDPQNSRN